MRAENPFRSWLEGDPYGGMWVPVARLGGWVAAASCPALFQAASPAPVLASTDWPIRLDSARPQIWHSYSETGITYNAELHPIKEQNRVSFHPFVAVFDPYTQLSWLEPIQPFILPLGGVAEAFG